LKGSEASALVKPPRHQRAALRGARWQRLKQRAPETPVAFVGGTQRPRPGKGCDKRRGKRKGV